MHYFTSSPTKQDSTASNGITGLIRRIFSSPAAVSNESTPPASPSLAAISSAISPPASPSPIVIAPPASAPVNQSPPSPRLSPPSSSDAARLQALPIVEVEPINIQEVVTQNHLSVIQKLKDQYIHCSEESQKQRLKEDIYNLIQEQLHDFLISRDHDRKSQKKDHLFLLELNSIISEIYNDDLAKIDAKSPQHIQAERTLDSEEIPSENNDENINSTLPISNTLRILLTLMENSTGQLTLKEIELAFNQLLMPIYQHSTTNIVEQVVKKVLVEYIIKIIENNPDDINAQKILTSVYPGYIGEAMLNRIFEKRLAPIVHEHIQSHQSPASKSKNYNKHVQQTSLNEDDEYVNYLVLAKEYIKLHSNFGEKGINFNILGKYLNYAVVKQNSNEALLLLDKFCTKDDTKCILYWLGLSLAYQENYIDAINSFSAIPENHPYYQRAMLECANLYMLGFVNNQLAKLYFEKAGVADESFLSVMMPKNNSDSDLEVSSNSDDTSTYSVTISDEPSVEADELERLYNRYLKSQSSKNNLPLENVTKIDMIEKAISPIFSSQGRFRELQKFIQKPENFNHPFRNKLVKHFGSEFFSPKSAANGHAQSKLSPARKISYQ